MYVYAPERRWIEIFPVSDDGVGEGIVIFEGVNYWSEKSIDFVTVIGDEIFAYYAARTGRGSKGKTISYAAGIYRSGIDSKIERMMDLDYEYDYEVQGISTGLVSDGVDLFLLHQNAIINISGDFGFYMISAKVTLILIPFVAFFAGIGYLEEKKKK